MSSNKPRPGKEVMKKFLVPRNNDFLLPDTMNAIAKAPVSVKPSAEAFISGFRGAMATVCMPVTLALASAQEWRFRQIHIAEMIRHQADPQAGASDPANAAALKQAQETMLKEVQSKEAINAIADSACHFLLEVHKKEDVERGASELLRQGTVLLWSAFEAFARDTIEHYLNAHPKRTLDLLSSAEGRRLFQLRSLDLDVLANYEFDISNKLGTVVTSAHDLTNLPAIKTVFGILFPQSDDLRTALASKELWVMSQRRHLIVHKRGIVDHRYLDNTGETLVVGQELSLSPKDLERYAAVTQQAVAQILTVLADEATATT